MNLKESFYPSSLQERKEFYEREFSIEKVKKWFRKNGLKLPQICAIDAGGDTGIIIDKNLKGEMLYVKFDELKEKIKKYVPEDVYYDRSRYKKPERVLRTLKFKEFVAQEFMFDIDVDNIQGKKLGGEKISNTLIKEAYKYAVKMAMELKREFKKVEIVYSGRGFHVYVFDKKARYMNFEERARFVRKFLKYPIDPWVSKGHIRLARLPYSLNGLVSRICKPIYNKFLIKETLPRFLKN